MIKGRPRLALLVLDLLLYLMGPFDVLTWYCGSIDEGSESWEKRTSVEQEMCQKEVPCPLPSGIVLLDRRQREPVVDLECTASSDGQCLPRRVHTNAHLCVPLWMEHTVLNMTHRATL